MPEWFEDSDITATHVGLALNSASLQLPNVTRSLLVNRLSVGLPSDFLRTGLAVRPKPNTRWTLVLSGGGVKGAFQVGAIQFLQQHTWPRAIAATSVGSVNALGLAERTHVAREKITDIWTSISAISDVYEPERWVKQVDSLEELKPGLVAFSLNANPRSLNYKPSDFNLLDTVRTTVDGAAGLLTVGFGATQLPIVGPFAAMYAVVSVDDMRDDVNRFTRIVEGARGIFNLGPLRRTLAASVDVDAIAASGVRLQLVSVALEQGDAWGISETGTVTAYNWNPRLLKHEPTDIGDLTRGERITQDALIFAAVASASIPALNPPVTATFPNGEDTVNDALVDGGVREILPVVQGLRLLESMNTGRAPKGMVAIGAGPVHPRQPFAMELASPSSNSELPLMRIVPRALDLALDEIETDELARLQQLSSEIDRIVVMPSLTVGSTTDVDPGIVQILLAYGWMRAFDVWFARERDLMDAQYLDLWRSTELLVELRYACWTLERTCRSLGKEYAPALDVSALSTTPADDRWYVDFLDGLPYADAFPLEGQVGRLEFQPGGIDLVERIRHLKNLIAQLVEDRVERLGLDSVPSVHELSSFSAGNVNTFSDWSLEWERHSLSPTLRGSRRTPWNRRFSYPTGPGMANPQNGGLKKFGRYSSPWDAPLRFGIAAGRPDDPDRRAFDIYLDRLRVSQGEAADRPDRWSIGSPDYAIVRLEGFVLDHQPDSGPGTARLRLAYRTRTRENVTTTRDWGAVRRTTDLGFVFAAGQRPRAPVPGTVPLWTFYSEKLKDYLTTSDRRRFGHEDSPRRPRETFAPDYKFDHLEGWVFDPDLPQPDGTSPLYRWFSPSRNDFATLAWTPEVDGQPVKNIPGDQL